MRKEQSIIIWVEDAMNRFVQLFMVLSASGFLFACSSKSDPAAPCPVAGKCPGMTMAYPQPLIGTKIPDVTLDAYHAGEITKVKLSGYRGKWLVLFFYPADFTFVCPTELRELAENYDKFKSQKAEVLSVSTDSVYVHRAWHDQNEAVKTVKFPMLSDRSGRLSRALGAFAEEGGHAVRASFVADPEGRIVAYEFHDETIGRSTEELLRKLEAAVAVRESHGDFCPASWKPGRDMIKSR